MLLALALACASCGDPSSVESFHQEPGAGLFPPPLECVPDSPDWATLSEPEPIKSELGAAVQVTASNTAGQTFELTYIGSSAESLDDYFATNSDARACIEAQQFDPESADEPPLPSLETSVVNAIAQSAGKTQDELAAYRDAQTPAPSLRDVAQHFGVMGSTVVKLVVDETRTTFSGVDRGTTKAAVEEVMGWDGSPPLIGSWEQPVNDEEFRQWINRSNSILVQISVADPNLDLPKSDRTDESDSTVLSIAAVFDPRVNAGKHVYYEANCSREAMVRLHAKAGRMSVYMWRRGPYLDVGSRRASAATIPDPTQLWHRSAKRRAADILVRGWQDGSKYTLDGQWNVGYGGGC